MLKLTVLSSTGSVEAAVTIFCAVCDLAGPSLEFSVSSTTTSRAVHPASGSSETRSKACLPTMTGALRSTTGEPAVTNGTFTGW